MRSSAMALALCTASIVAQADDPVRVVTSFDAEAADTIREHLESLLPGEAFRVEQLTALELSGRFRDGIDVDLFVGVDAQLLVVGASRGDFAPRTCALPSLWVDEANRFVVPWARGWVWVWRPGVIEQPKSLTDLARTAMDGKLALPSPRAAPTLWAGWMQQLTYAGRGEEELFSWLGALDARVEEYHPSAASAASAFELGRADVAVLSSKQAMGVLDRANQRAALGLGDEGMVLQALGVALVAESPRLTRAERAFDAACEPQLSTRLRSGHGVLTPPLSAVGHGLEQLVERVEPFVPVHAELALAALGRWEKNVRGEGAYLERLGLAFDIGFTLLFFGAVYWIFRNTQQSEAPASDAAAT